MKKYLVILFGIFLISFVSAVPSPHGFYGTVIDSNGKIVIEGIITTEINEVEVGSCNIINGNYDLIVESEYGGLIYFYFESLEKPLTNYTFDAFEITELNLIIPVPELPTIEYDEEDSHSHTSNIKHPCEPSWDCGGWSSCNEGVKVRTCYDINHCEYPYNKPTEITGCEISEKVLIEKDNYLYILAPFGILNIIALLILLVMLIKK